MSRAQYDLDTAKAMLDAERHFYVYFCCQQAVEKALKAIIAAKTKKLPPRLHNLRDLAGIAGVEADGPRLKLMLDLTNFYIHSRYPGSVGGFADEGGTAADVLRKSEEMVQWIYSSGTK